MFSRPRMLHVNVNPEVLTSRPPLLGDGVGTQSVASSS